MTKPLYLNVDRSTKTSLSEQIRQGIATAIDSGVLEPGARDLIPTGVQIALPAGYEAQVRPRSGLAVEHGVTVLNSPGTIDSDYRGEVKALLVNHGGQPFEITRGMRVAQIVVAPVTRAILVEAEELGETVRGVGGFGSTGIGGEGGE